MSNFDTDATFNNIIDTTLFTGVTTVGLSSSSANGDTQFTNLGNLVAAEMRNGSGDLSVAYTAAAVAGTADTQNLTLSAQTAGTFTAAKVETLAITSELSANTLTAITAADMTKLTVAGSASLKVTGALATKTIDASAATGAVNVTLTTADQSVTGGSAADIIDTVTMLTSADTINGGSGTDTLKMTVGNATVAVGTSASKGALFNVSGIEVIDVASTADTAVLDLDNTVGVTNVVAAANVKTYQVTAVANSLAIAFTLNGVAYTTDATDGNATAAEAAALINTKINTISGFSSTVATDTVTITATTGEAIEISAPTGGATAATISAYGAVQFTNMAAGQAVDIFSAGAVTANLKSAAGTSDAMSVNFKTTSGDKGFNHGVTSFTTLNVETLNLDVSGMTDVKVTTLGTLNATGTKTVNITGDSDLVVSTWTGADFVTIDGSTSSGDLTVGSTASKDQSIKTGSGNDTIVMGANLTAADTIDGGANNTATGSTSIGKDSLTATGNIGTTTTAAALKIANVETITLAIGGASTTNIDAAAITGATALNVSATSGTVKVTNLAQTTKIGVGEGTAVLDGTLDLTLADATGAADSISLTYASTLDTASSTTLKIAAAVETLNVAATTNADNARVATLVNTDMAATNIVVTGGQIADTLALGTLNAATTNVNASAHAGKITLTTAATGAVTLSAIATAASNMTAGAGADTISLVGNLGAVVHTIAGGAGNDILNVTINNASSDFTSVTGVETINLTLATGTAVVGFDNATKDDGLNLATTLNVLGGDSLSVFTLTTGEITDAGAVTMVDASTFSGALNITLGADTLDANLTIKGGSSTADKVTTSVSTNTTAEIAKSMTGVETLVLNSVNSDTDARIDLTNVIGLTTLTTAFTNTANADNLNVSGLATGVKVTAASTNTGDTLIIDLLDKAGAANALTLELVAANYNAAGDTLTFTSAGVETLNVTAKNTNAGLLNLAGVAATSSTGNVTVNVSGTGGLTLKALSSLTNVVNASTATGAIVLASGDRAATAMTITTGEAGDTVAMRHGNDVLNGGLGTDTLVLTPNFVLGGVLIDLNSATDQVTTFNGSANAAVQIGFENVDLSGVTGTFGADVTAKSTGSTITGTANADVVTGGAGADTVFATASADTVTLAGGNDTFVLDNVTLDTVDAGAGTGDAIALVGGTTVANTVDFGTYTNFEKFIASGATAAVISFSAKADVDTDMADLRTIDLSADTDTTGSNVIDLSLVDGAYVVTGSAGVDTITHSLGVDNVTGGAGTDSIIIGAAAGTGVATAGTTSTSTTTLDKYFVGALTDNDTIDLTTILATEGGYDAFTTINNGGNIALTVAANTGTDGTVSLITGVYDAAANTFTSTASAGGTCNAVMISAAASDAGTTATDSIIIVGAVGLTNAAFAIANGIITI